MLVVPSSTIFQPYSTYFQAFATLYAQFTLPIQGVQSSWVDIISLQAHLVGLRSNGGGSWWVRHFHCLGGVTGDQGLRRSCEGLRKTLATKQGCDTETLITPPDFGDKGSIKNRSPVKLPGWRQAGHFVIQNGETAYKMMFLSFFKYAPILKITYPKSLGLTKWLGWRNTISSQAIQKQCPKQRWPNIKLLQNGIIGMFQYCNCKKHLP